MRQQTGRNEVRAYLDLLKKSLNNSLYLGTDSSACDSRYYSASQWKLPAALRPYTLCNQSQLDFLERLMDHLVNASVTGDFMEAGVWRGGAAIFMRAFLSVRGGDRRVWLLDTFAGIPQSTGSYRYENDMVDQWADRWEASLLDVKEHFRRYGLLDDGVGFLEGPVQQTLLTAPFNKIALARLDVDSYESYSAALNLIYPRMAEGGCIVIDDWHLEPCRQAVRDFLESSQIDAQVSEEFLGHPADAHWFVSHHA
ncbi:TylF/MycF/NovP-related O-methyltransferase [Paraburkholderia sp.]|jgi:O-methyltransferase